MEGVGLVAATRVLVVRVIWKYPIEAGEFEHVMPERHGVVHVGCPDDQPFMWVAVHTDQPSVKQRFLTVATGQEFDSYADDGERFLWEYRGTFKVAGHLGKGWLIFHLHELVDLEEPPF